MTSHLLFPTTVFRERPRWEKGENGKNQFDGALHQVFSAWGQEHHPRVHLCDTPHSRTAFASLSLAACEQLEFVTLLCSLSWLCVPPHTDDSDPYLLPPTPLHFLSPTSAPCLSPERHPSQAILAPAGLPSLPDASWISPSLCPLQCRAWLRHQVRPCCGLLAPSWSPTFSSLGMCWSEPGGPSTHPSSGPEIKHSLGWVAFSDATTSYKPKVAILFPQSFYQFIIIYLYHYFITVLFTIVSTTRDPK